MPVTPLPRRLQYLGPVIDQLATVPSEKLNEDNEFAFSVVNSALRERVAGLSQSKAERTLEQDADALSVWLAQPGQEQSVAHFIAGSFIGILSFGGTEQLLAPESEPEPPPPKFTVAIDPPDGFEVSESHGWIVLKGQKLDVSITPFIDAPWTLLTPQPAGVLAALGSVDTKVTFGAASGTKRLSVIDRHVYLKDVRYVLEVPGGWVYVVVQSDREFDESILESRFHTLRVIPTEAQV